MRATCSIRLPSNALVARARRYWKWAVFGHSRALIGHIRHPVTKFGWLKRAGFIVWQTVTLPFTVPLRSDRGSAPIAFRKRSADANRPTTARGGRERFER